MSARVKLAFVVAVAVAAGVTAVALASNGASVKEKLSGYEETPLALSTPGEGRFEARIDRRNERISYRLSYANLESPVTQAHIHFGSPSQSGGISVFLCTNLGNGPAGTQACPAQPATITGTITPADVIGPASQGIAAGEFGELLAAMRAGMTYANVHSEVRQAGEIRAQIERGNSD
jgi:CHRD domain